MRKAINKKIFLTMQTLYPYISEDQKLTEPSKISDIIQDDTMFLILYSQLYYRQIHNSTTQPTLNQRIKSFENYQVFFRYLLEGEAYLKLTLPDQWLWELMEEFVNQYESFSDYRSNFKNKTKSELEILRTYNHVWDSLYVLKTLYMLMDKAIGFIKSKTFVESYLLYQKVGHFAIYCLLRIQTLLGDYHEAIRILDERCIFPTVVNKVVFSRLTGCQFSVAYHASFSYMMMQRYTDAVNIISNTMKFFQDHNRIYKTKGYQNSKIQKQTKQMLNLLCICFVLKNNINSITCSYITNKSIVKIFKGNSCDEKLDKLEKELDQRKEFPNFKSCFLESCPNFISLVFLNLDDPSEDYSKEATHHQMKIFLDEVRQHAFFPSMKHKMESALAKNMKKTPLFTFTKNFVINRENNKFNQPLQKQFKKAVIIEGIRHLMRMKNKTTHVVRDEGQEIQCLKGNLETATGVTRLYYYFCFNPLRTGGTHSLQNF